MEKLTEKMGSYELLNNLFPGSILFILLAQHTGYQFGSNHLVVDFFIAYFMGLVSGRVGSLVIEPLFKKLKIISAADYQDFVDAWKKDSKLEIISATSNMYRSFVAVGKGRLIIPAEKCLKE